MLVLESGGNRNEKSIAFLVAAVIGLSALPVTATDRSSTISVCAAQSKTQTFGDFEYTPYTNYAEINTRYSEMAISIIMSTGIGLAGILSGFVKNGTNFNSFLFGSIISISKDELKIVCVISVLVLLCVLLLYKELFYIGFDENAARISGVPVKTINFIFTLLTALTVSIASRTVGTLIVSSMLVIPIACGMQVGRSYKAVMIIGVITALVTTVIGLTLSYYVGLKPGGTIVLLGRNF